MPPVLELESSQRKDISIKPENSDDVFESYNYNQPNRADFFLMVCAINTLMLAVQRIF